MSIESFADKGTQDIWDGLESKAARKALPETLWDTARRKLELLDTVEDLRQLDAPGLRLKKLKGKMAAFYSLRINDQYRIIFQWQSGAYLVEITDYH